MIEKQIIQNLQLLDEAKNDVTASADNSLRDPLHSSDHTKSRIKPKIVLLFIQNNSYFNKDAYFDRC